MTGNDQVTPGQLKQLICKLIAAVPANAISFAEMERLLRDGKLQRDIAERLRRHSSDEPISVLPPEDALAALRYIIGINFVYYQDVNRPVEESILGHESDPFTMRGLIKRLSRTRTKPAPATLEVISFEVGIQQIEVVARLNELGYRSADACEAAGFLQARGLRWRNPGKQNAPYTFQIMDEKGISTLEFTTHDEPGHKRQWTLTGCEFDVFHGFLPNEILAAKL
jgi:hypothetical protein